MIYKCIDCQKSIHKHTFRYGTKRCSKCARKLRFGNNAPAYKDGRTLKSNRCKKCGKDIKHYAIWCLKCSYIIRSKKRKEYLKAHPEIMIGKNNPNYGNHKLKGKNNPNWKGGLSSHLYSVEFSKSLKREIFERDGFTCQLCKKYPCSKLHAHHIDYDKKNCNKKNLVSLCPKCHINTNFNRFFWKNLWQCYMEDMLHLLTVHKIKAEKLFHILLKRIKGNEKSVILIGGISGTGKSEIAWILQQKFYKRKLFVLWLRLDNFYKILPKDRMRIRYKKGIKSVGIDEVNWESVNIIIKNFKRVNNPYDVLIVEGLYANHLKRKDIGIYLEGSIEQTYSFRKKRGKENPDDEFRQKILKKESKEIRQTKLNSDIIVNWEGEIK